MANAVAPEIASKHPELAGDVAGINALESAIRRTIHAACYSSQERYEARLAALDDATRDVCMHVVNGILPVDAEQKGRFFLMPPGGARALNAMTEAERTGLAEITQCVNWKLKPDMSEDDMQAALQKSLMHACDETLWITQLAKIEQRLAEKPDDAYLLSGRGPPRRAADGADGAGMCTSCQPSQGGKAPWLRCCVPCRYQHPTQSVSALGPSVPAAVRRCAERAQGRL